LELACEQTKKYEENDHERHGDHEASILARDDPIHRVPDVGHERCTDHESDREEDEEAADHSGSAARRAAWIEAPDIFREARSIETAAESI
jgi:hypothetical protein